MGAFECANCGEDREPNGLLRCSRCRNEYFCSSKCQKAYWPFHKSNCKVNELADIIASSDPKLAKWMRDHGKQAVLKDAEIDRLERASQAFSGVVGRAELLAKMSGRVDPMASIASTYTESEKMAVTIQEQKESKSKKSQTDKAWNSFVIVEGLGVDSPRYKWRQSLSSIEIFVIVPSGLNVKRHMRVDIEPNSFSLVLGPDSDILYMKGQLLKPIEKVSSTWFIVDGVLHVTLLKHSRKGKGYGGGDCSSTWWPRLFETSGPLESIPLAFPPSFYYSLPMEEWTDSKSSVLGRRAITASPAHDPVR